MERFFWPCSTWRVQNSLNNANAGKPLAQDCPFTSYTTVTSPEAIFPLTWRHVFNIPMYKINAMCTERTTAVWANNMRVKHEHCWLIQQLNIIVCTSMHSTSIQLAFLTSVQQGIRVLEHDFVRSTQWHKYTLPHLLKYTGSLRSRDILDGTNGVRIREVPLCMVCFPIWMALCEIVHMYHSNSQLTVWLGVNTQVHRGACWKEDKQVKHYYVTLSQNLHSWRSTIW